MSESHHDPLVEQRWQRGVVVGASSGIGEALARHLAGAGTTVALVSRRGEVLEQICEEINAAAFEKRAYAFVHDVHDTAAAAPLLQQIATELGGLDLVIYSSGILPRIGPNEYRTETDIETIEVNFAGAVAWLNAAAERFYEMRGGTIIGISSVAGDRGRRGNPVYNATKSALSTYLEALRCRLAARGVQVLTAKPGYIRTPMLGNAKVPAPVATPEQAARDILVAAAAGRRVAYIPGWWRLAALAMRAVPSPIFERLPIP